MATPGRCRNRWCRTPDRSFSVVFAVGPYQGALRSAIVRFKYRDELWWAPVFANLVEALLVREERWFEDFDVITAVPAYTGWGSRRARDPVGEVLGELHEQIGRIWEIRPDVLVKCRETPALQGRRNTERRRLAEGALRSSLRITDGSAVDGARVLVFDDVLTEGSTLNEVARALLSAGALEVAGLVLARTPWGAHGSGPALPDRPAVGPDRPAVGPDRPAVGPDRPAVGPGPTDLCSMCG
jgi:predicted amidophosphoribosyltransferase